MKAFAVRRDRAEVMGVAAIVLVTVARWLRLRSMITPRVGVREGLLHELAAAQMAPPEPTAEQRKACANHDGRRGILRLPCALRSETCGAGSPAGAAAF